MSIDRFLIADNPMREHGTTAIIHTQAPISILLINEEHITTKWPHKHYTYTNSDWEQEQYTLSMFHCFMTSFDGEEQNILIEKLLKNTWHWYMSYMNWQDQQINEE